MSMIILYYKQLRSLKSALIYNMMKVHVQKMVKITLALLSVIQLKEEELLSMLQLLFNAGSSTI